MVFSSSLKNFSIFIFILSPEVTHFLPSGYHNVIKMILIDFGTEIQNGARLCKIFYLRIIMVIFSYDSKLGYDFEIKI